MSKHKAITLSIAPSVDICEGRDALCEEIFEGVLDCHAALLFGGRQAGKTTVLLQICNRINGPRRSRFRKADGHLAVYVNMQELPPAASIASIYRFLAKKTSVMCRARLEKMLPIRLPSKERQKDSSPDLFAADLKSILAATKGEIRHITILCDEAKRILNSAYTAALLDNMFALLYGTDLDLAGKFGIVFSGAQELYTLCIDNTSPIGSRASKHVVHNLAEEDITKLASYPALAIKPKHRKAVASRVYNFAGGHAGLCSGLLRQLALSGSPFDAEMDEVIRRFIAQRSEVLKVWHTSLTPEAMIIHDVLVDEPQLDFSTIVSILVEHGKNRFQADRVIEQFLFTGIARIKNRNLQRINSIYWDYVLQFVSYPKKIPFVDTKKTIRSTSGIRLFISYSHRDEALREQLEAHLKMMHRTGCVAQWHDRKITAGSKWKAEIDSNLEAADVVLLLVSSDFIASDYCYEIEMKRAMTRHEARLCVVVPVIVRSCDWQISPFGELQGLPKDGKPITLWTDRDQAWTDVAKGISKVVKQLLV